MKLLLGLMPVDIVVEKKVLVRAPRIHVKGLKHFQKLNLTGMGQVHDGLTQVLNYISDKMVRKYNFKRPFRTVI